MARIPLPARDAMTAEQVTVHDQVVAGPRGTIIGPLRAAIHNPELATAWSALGEVLRFRTSLPKRLSELAIIITARRHNSQVEWWVHARAAAEAGLPVAVIDALREGRAPCFDDAAEAEIHAFTRALHHDAKVPLPVYNAVLARWGARGVVDLTALIGYYTMVSFTLNAHEIPLPDGVATPLMGDTLTPLPEAAA
ncbi:MAG: carboxymuconolactone decarboxylase family protein [Rubritepida sp.]|nr:carboxymuconolactone decarboxylase family protein [Rubritepida sp.]